MTKPIKSEHIKDIPSNHIPYRNRHGYWVWRRPDIPADPNWPGAKAPSWAKGAVYSPINKCWCWTDEIN